MGRDFAILATAEAAARLVVGWVACASAVAAALLAAGLLAWPDREVLADYVRPAAGGGVERVAVVRNGWEWAAYKLTSRRYEIYPWRVRWFAAAVDESGFYQSDMDEARMSAEGDWLASVWAPGVFAGLAVPVATVAALRARARRRGRPATWFPALRFVFRSPARVGWAAVAVLLALHVASLLCPTSVAAWRFGPIESEWGLLAFHDTFVPEYPNPECAIEISWGHGFRARDWSTFQPWEQPPLALAFYQGLGVVRDECGLLDREKLPIRRSYPLLIAAASVPLVAGWLARRTAPRRGDGCVACGYDLRASPARCPECGRPRNAADTRAPRVSLTSRLIALPFAVLLVASTALFLSAATAGQPVPWRASIAAGRFGVGFETAADSLRVGTCDFTPAGVGVGAYTRDFDEEDIWQRVAAVYRVGRRTDAEGGWWVHLPSTHAAVVLALPAGVYLLASGRRAGRMVPAGDGPAPPHPAGGTEDHPAARLGPEGVPPVASRVANDAAPS
jgi:hypothetical protein